MNLMNLLMTKNRSFEMLFVFGFWWGFNDNDKNLSNDRFLLHSQPCICLCFCSNKIFLRETNIHLSKKLYIQSQSHLATLTYFLGNKVTDAESTGPLMRSTYCWYEDEERGGMSNYVALLTHIFTEYSLQNKGENNT